MGAYNIRKATPEDAPLLIELTRENSVRRNSLAPGFLEFPIPTEHEYRVRLDSSPFCYVASAAETFGFLLAYPRRSLEQGLVAGPIAERLLQLEGNFVYLEQCAVAEQYRRKGTARALFVRCLEDAAQEGYHFAHGATSHRPIKNVPLINIHHELSFHQIEEVSFDGLTFGLYSRSLH